MISQFQNYQETGKVSVYIEIKEGQKPGASALLHCKRYSADEIKNAPYVPSLTYDSKMDGQMQIARRAGGAANH